MELIRSMKELYEDVIIIVVTGGPCAGKTSLIERVVELLQRHDFAVATLTETPTELVGANLSPSYYSTEDFQELVIRAQLRKEHIWCRGLLKKDTDKQRVLICDRGVFDSLAYSESSVFYKIINGLDVGTAKDLMLRYNLVVHMVTAADGAEEHYTLENNTARTESADEAKEMDEATKQAWEPHPNHMIVDNSTGFTEKVMRAIQAFGRVLDMPETREKERKYLVTDYDVAAEFVSEADLSGVKLQQAYLEISEDIERRVRRREDMDMNSEVDAESGEVVFVYNEKTPTDDLGERVETPNKHLTEDEYHDKVERSDFVLMQKDRYFLFANGYRFVIDFIEEPVHRAYVEVEVVSMDEDPQLPGPLDKVTKQVTGQQKHSAAEIVRRNS